MFALLRNTGLATGFATGLAIGLAQPVVAASAVEDLYEALEVGYVVDVMREEGLIYGRELAEEMIPGGPSQDWEEVIDRIYDTDRMNATVKAGFMQVFGDADAAPLADFFTTGAGAQFVDLENAARKAMSDPDMDAAAREAAASRFDRPDQRLDLIQDFIEANDLIETNVEGALNASYQFYLGLSEGGAIDSGEDALIADVYAQEEEIRTDTHEWVYAFLLMAYQPMSDADIQAYLDLSRTDAGKALNRGLFAGFDQMYGDISYALGLAISQAMEFEEL